MPPFAAWAVLIVGYVLPLVHVALTRTIAPRPATAGNDGQGGGRCPFSPRLGWLVIVLLLGPVGWLLFMASRRHRRTGGGA